MNRITTRGLDRLLTDNRPRVLPVEGSIDITQSHVGVVDSADVLVKIEKEIPVAPQIKKWANVCVLATAKSNPLNGKLITSAEQADVVEKSELNFVGKVRVWTGELNKKLLREMSGYGETVVVLSGRTADSINKDFGDMIAVFSETGTTTTMDDVVKKTNRCVFVDPGKEGKALYAVTSLLNDGLGYTNQIVNSSFTGVVDPDIADALDDLGFSYFFCATDRIWLRGFWIGGQQARKEYAERSIRCDIKQITASVISAGVAFTDENLALIEARILQSLKSNSLVDRVLNVSVPRQSAVNKVRGVVAGVVVKFEAGNEIRTIHIKLGGA